MIYDLRCRDCGHFEKDVSLPVDERDTQPCPMCGELLEVVISPVGTVFGNSFYKGMGVKRCIIKRETEDGKIETYDMSKHIDSNGNKI